MSTRAAQSLHLAFIGSLGSQEQLTCTTVALILLCPSLSRVKILEPIIAYRKCSLLERYKEVISHFSPITSTPKSETMRTFHRRR
jgi:hypothetical protein